MNKAYIALTAAVSLFIGAVTLAFIIETFGKAGYDFEHKSPFDYNKTVETITARINSHKGWEGYKSKIKPKR